MDRVTKVSVIIPVYNTGRYLRQCLDTVCGQTLKELQIICVDDGSTDYSVDILKEYAARDSRIEVLYHEHTGKGAAGARNMGLQHAVGEYLLILDSDDYFALDLAEKAYAKAKETDSDIVIYNATYIDNTGKSKGTGGIINRSVLPYKEVFCVNDCPNKIFQITSGMAWSRLWKHSFIKENNHTFQSVRWLDDCFFTYTAMVTAKRISILDENLVIYRRNAPGSQSLSKDEDKGNSSIEFYRELKRYLQDKNIYELVEYSYLLAKFSHYLQRLKSVNSYETFKVIYNLLNKGELKDISDNCNKQFADKKSWIDNYKENVVREIETLSPEEFLFNRFVKQKDRRVVFPESLVKQTDKVVIYGAGSVGKSYFAQNMENRYCMVVGWIDRNYLKKGYPVCSPKEIVNMSFDKIIIAIEDEDVAKTIAQDLTDLGVNKDCVLWEYPYYED